MSKRKLNSNNANNQPRKRAKIDTEIIIASIKDGKYKLIKNSKGSARCWKHCRYVFDPTQQKAVATQCLYCDHIWSVNTGTGNIDSHLTKIHSDKLNKTDGKRQQSLEQCNKRKITEFKAEHKSEMTESLVKFCVLDQRSFLAVEGTGMDVALTTAYNLGVKTGKYCDSVDSAGLICRHTTISRRVDTEYESEKEACIKDFKTVLETFPPAIQFTTDDSEFKHKHTNEKVFGLSATYVLRNNTNLQLVYLGNDKYKDKLIELNANEEFQQSVKDDEKKEVDDWDEFPYSSDEDCSDEDSDCDGENEAEIPEIDLGANAANLQKMIKYYFYQFGLSDLLQDFNIEGRDDISFDNLKNTITTDNASHNKKAFLFWHLLLILCFNHNWNLAIKWMIKMTKKRNKTFKRLFRMLKKIIKKIKQSGLMNEFDPPLKQIYEIRWKYLYQTLKSVNAGNNFAKLQEVCIKLGRRDLMVRIDAGNMKQLELFFESTAIIHAHFECRYVPRIHHVITYTHNVLFRLTLGASTEYSVVRTLKKQLNKQTLIRVVPKIVMVHWKAMILNPLTKKNDKLLDGVEYIDMITKETVVIDSKEKYKEALMEIEQDLNLILIYDEYQRQKQRESLSSNEDVDLGEIEENQNESNVNDTYSMFDYTANMSAVILDVKQEKSVKDELNEYLEMKHTKQELKIYDENTLKFWNREIMYSIFPRLTRYALFIAAIQASNTPSECLFSLDNNIVTERRTALGYQKVGRLSFLVSRWKLCKK